MCCPWRRLECRVQHGSAAATQAAGPQAVAGYELAVKFVLSRYLIQQAPEAAFLHCVGRWDFAQSHPQGKGVVLWCQDVQRAAGKLGGAGSSAQGGSEWGRGCLQELHLRKQPDNSQLGLGNSAVQHSGSSLVKASLR